MALSVLINGSGKLPALGRLATSLIRGQCSSKLVISPIVAREFTSLSRAVNGKGLALCGSQIVQRRHLTHSTIWAYEKLLSVALLGIIPACVAFPSLITDNFLATAVVIHMHWGVESVVVDYIRPALVGPILPKIARFMVYVVSAFTLGGLIYFNYNDIGLAKAVQKVWSIKGGPLPPPPDPKKKKK